MLPTCPADFAWLLTHGCIVNAGVHQFQARTCSGYGTSTSQHSTSVFHQAHSTAHSTGQMGVAAPAILQGQFVATQQMQVQPQVPQTVTGSSVESGLVQLLATVVQVLQGARCVTMFA